VIRTHDLPVVFVAAGVDGVVWLSRFKRDGVRAGLFESELVMLMGGRRFERGDHEHR
jgi:hypothetical protein